MVFFFFFCSIVLLIFVSKIYSTVTSIHIWGSTINPLYFFFFFFIHLPSTICCFYIYIYSIAFCYVLYRLMREQRYSLPRVVLDQYKISTLAHTSCPRRHTTLFDLSSLAHFALGFDFHMRLPWSLR
jgi:hypothetical protein